MAPLTYALQFRGRASRSPSRRMVAELSAPSSALVTNLLVEGLRGRYELAAGGEARLRSELVMEDGELRSDRTITFAPGDELRFRTVGTAPPTTCPDPHLKQASVISEVDRRNGPVRRRMRQIARTSSSATPARSPTPPRRDLRRGGLP